MATDKPKPKIKRTRQFKTADYQLAMASITKRAVELSLQINPKFVEEWKVIPSDEYTKMPQWQKLMYSYLDNAIQTSKFRQRELL